MSSSSKFDSLVFLGLVSGEIAKVRTVVAILINLYRMFRESFRIGFSGFIISVVLLYIILLTLGKILQLPALKGKVGPGSFLNWFLGIIFFVVILLNLFFYTVTYFTGFTDYYIFGL